MHLGFKWLYVSSCPIVETRKKVALFCCYFRFCFLTKINSKICLSLFCLKNKQHMQKLELIIKERKLRWFGYILRMVDGKLLK